MSEVERRARMFAFVCTCGEMSRVTKSRGGESSAWQEQFNWQWFTSAVQSCNSCWSVRLTDLWFHIFLELLQMHCCRAIACTLVESYILLTLALDLETLVGCPSEKRVLGETRVIVRSSNYPTPITPTLWTSQKIFATTTNKAKHPITFNPFLVSYTRNIGIFYEFMNIIYK